MEPNFDPSDFGFCWFDNNYCLLIGDGLFLVLHQTSISYMPSLWRPHNEWNSVWYDRKIGRYEQQKTHLFHSVKTEQDLIALYGGLTGRLLVKQEKYK